jgi:serine/threonine protein phosphatase PrpC
MSLYKKNDENDSEIFNFETSSISSVGGRKINEDNLKFKTDELSFWIVCDGLGGLNKGEVASQLAVENFEKKFLEKKEFTEENLVNIIEEVNGVILEVANERTVRMATTLTTVIANKNSVLFGYLGDTRLYYFRNKKLVFHTKDHSVVQKYVDIGKLKYDNIRHSPERNILTRVLGIEEECEADSISIPIKVLSNDAILICSDGFWEYVLEKEMEYSLKESKNPDEWIKSMESIILKRVENLKNDNYTAIAVFISNKN